MSNGKLTQQRYSLSSLIARIVVLVLGAMTLGIFLQNYYFSSQIIEQEVTRSKQQTSALLHNLFDNHLSVLQMHHNSNAKSGPVRDYYANRDPEALELFFLGIDQADPLHTPEIRFITQQERIIWDDGNAYFYGISDNALAQAAKIVAFSGTWHYVPLATDQGQRHTLIRRTPTVDIKSGEVLGQGFAVVVLDSNFPLLEWLQTESNSLGVVLSVAGRPIAHSLNDNEPYDLNKLMMLYDGMRRSDDFLVARTHIQVNDVRTGLELIAIQDNSNVASMQLRHIMVILISIAIMVMLSFTLRLWVQSLVSKALKNLMNYTKSAGGHQPFEPFMGSDIKEFEHIGMTLQDTFKQLESQKRSFQDLFNFALSPIMVWSEQGLLLQMNPAARQELVVDNRDSNENGEQIFQSFRQLLIPHLELAAQGATLMGINVPIGDKTFRWNLSPIKVESGISGIIVQGQDITTLIDAEKQSNRARKEAERAAQTRADFLAKMSHEIRTPLNGILGIAQILKQSTSDREEAKQVEVLCNSGEHLLAVLNDILDFSKLEQGKLHKQTNAFLFTETVNTLENIYHPICLEKGVNLASDNQIPADCQLVTDQVRLNQILFNLTSNAVKFTHHGEISLTFALEGGVCAQHPSLYVCVRDTGIGIEQDKLSAIFEPFVQAEETTTRVYGGSGLGLTIVQNLVEMLEGQIHVSSVFGAGSSFVLKIPVECAAYSKVAFESLPVLAPSEIFERTLHVLLVEDNHTNAFIIQTFCGKYNMNVDWVKDGYDALDRLARQHFDLVLMDNQLPKLDGIETTRLIREQLGLDVPIFACTADTQKATEVAFLSAGANAIILKPIKEAELHQRFLEYRERHFNL